MNQSEEDIMKGVAEGKEETYRALLEDFYGSDQQAKSILLKLLRKSEANITKILLSSFQEGDVMCGELICQAFYPYVKSLIKFKIAADPSLLPILEQGLSKTHARTKNRSNYVSTGASGTYAQVKNMPKEVPGNILSEYTNAFFLDFIDNINGYNENSSLKGQIYQNLSEMISKIVDDYNLGVEKKSQEDLSSVASPLAGYTIPRGNGLQSSPHSPQTPLDPEYQGSVTESLSYAKFLRLKPITKKLIKALGRLEKKDPDSFLMLVMHYFGGHSYKDLCSFMKINSVGEVSVKLSDIILNLQKDMNY